MAIEFTRLADVTAIEEVKDEDTVLVVQDGEVKRAPKTAVGGAGGGEKADLVIRINKPLGLTNTTVDDIEIVSGSVEAVYTAFESGEFPVVEIEFLVTPSMDSYWRGASIIPAQVSFYGDSMMVGFIGVGSFCDPYVYYIVYNANDNYAISDFRMRQITIQA